MTYAEFHRRFEQGLLTNDRSSLVKLLVETNEVLVSHHLPDFVHDTWVDQVWKFCDDVLDHGQAGEVFYLHCGISRISVGWFQGRLTVELTENSSDKAKRVWNAETAATP